MPARKNIGFLIKQINNNYERELNRYLKKIGLTSSQYEILDYLLRCGRKDVCIKDVQQALNYKQPTVTGILTRLEEKEFISLEGSADDKRCKNILLKENAHEIQKKMEREKRKAEQLLTAGMSVEDKSQVYRLLRQILENIVE